tara:strand:- start:1055 stop:2257 length:1203 start_codon:yes stop_codon:yes gene_type:complete
MNFIRDYINILLEGDQAVRTPLNISIPADLQDIHKRMGQAGKELYVVGGAVRDTLMNKSPKDYDLATNATPDEVIRILESHGRLKLDLTGKSFGVVRTHTPDGNEYEIATFRKDIGKGRRPDDVEFTTIADDVQRRDLTINALFYDMDTGEVVDYVGGIDDIKNGVIRAVGDPAQRFDEDRLRILRAARFAGRMGSDLDPETKQAIIDDNELTGVTPERIRDEFIKGVASAQDVNSFLQLLEELDLFGQIFPGLKVDVVGPSSNESIVGIAAMLDNNDPGAVAETLKQMRYSNDEINTIKFLVELKNMSRETAPSLKKSFARYQIDPMQIEKYATITGTPTASAVSGFLEFVRAPPAGDSKELMAQGLRGPEIGKAMADAEMASYDQLVQELRMYIRELL